jgi:hypothetical protein
MIHFAIFFEAFYLTHHAMVLSTNVSITHPILNDVIFSGIPLDAKVVQGYDTICKAMGHLD